MRSTNLSFLALLLSAVACQTPQSVEPQRVVLTNRGDPSGHGWATDDVSDHTFKFGAWAQESHPRVGIEIVLERIYGSGLKTGEYDLQVHARVQMAEGTNAPSGATFRAGPAEGATLRAKWPYEIVRSFEAKWPYLISRRRVSFWRSEYRVVHSIGRHEAIAYVSIADAWTMALADHVFVRIETDDVDRRFHFGRNATVCPQPKECQAWFSVALENMLCAAGHEPPESLAPPPPEIPTPRRDPTPEESVR